MGKALELTGTDPYVYTREHLSSTLLCHGESPIDDEGLIDLILRDTTFGELLQAQQVQESHITRGLIKVYGLSPVRWWERVTRPPREGWMREQFIRDCLCRGEGGNGSVRLNYSMEIVSLSVEKYVHLARVFYAVCGGWDYYEETLRKATPIVGSRRQK